VKLSRLKYHWPLEAFDKAFDYYQELGLKAGLSTLFFYLYLPFDIFFSNVKRIIDYVPLLWRDRDWDHSFLMDMLEFKLTRIEKALKAGHCRHDPHKMRDLRSMISLLKRIKASEYHDTVFKDHDKKWGKLKLNFGVKEKLGDTYVYKSCVTRSKVKTKEDEQLEAKESRRLYSKVNKLEQEDLDLFFRLLRKRIESLWD
jgi:hypothetical protein